MIFVGTLFDYYHCACRNARWFLFGTNVVGLAG